MTTRVTKNMLERRLAAMKKICGDDYSLDWGYGRPQLENASGSRTIINRLTKGQMYDAMFIYQQGFEDAQRDAPRNSAEGMK